MNSVILTKNYTEPPFCEKEILRYAGCKRADEEILALARTCVDEIRSKLTYKVCYRELEVEISDDVCDFGAFAFKSKALAKNLSGCKTAIFFAATVGVEIDRAISKYGRISPSKALMLQSVGTERIEALCDAFCEDIAREYSLAARPRFSAGYGDLPLDCQMEIFSVLSPEKYIGVFLADSLLMSPSKSVTAIVGLREGEKSPINNKCSGCNQKDCQFRGAL